MTEKENFIINDVFKFNNQNKFNEEKNKFLYELALKRGKNRGWYPNDWTLQDYMKHIFCRNIESVY